MNIKCFILLVLAYFLLVGCKKIEEPVVLKTNCQLVKYSSLSNPIGVSYIGTRYKTWYDVTYDKSGRKDKVSITRDGEQSPYGFNTYEYTDSMIIFKYTVPTISQSIPETAITYKLNKMGFVDRKTTILRGKTNTIEQYEYNLDGYVSKVTSTSVDDRKTVWIYNYQTDGSLILNSSDGFTTTYIFYENTPIVFDNLSERISRNMIKSILYSGGMHTRVDFAYEFDKNRYLYTVTQLRTRRDTGEKDFSQLKFEKYDCQ